MTEIFKSMVKDRAYNVVELGLTYFLRTFEVDDPPFQMIPVFSDALVPPFRDLYQQGERHRAAAGSQRQGLSTRRLTIEDAFVAELMDT